MQSRDSCPFGRGETAYGIGGTIDSSNLLFAELLGASVSFQDDNPTTKAKNSQAQVLCVAMRNKTGGALLPGDVVLFSGTTFGETGATVTQSASPNVFAGVVDEYLPAAGCPNNDVCWIVVRGPTTAKITTKSGAAAAGGLVLMPSATNNGKLDFIDTTPDDDAEAMNQAIYGNFVSEGAIADLATTARVFVTRNPFGL